MMTIETVTQQQPEVWKLQFLTDVVTAAGLLSCGKQSKALAERIASDAMRMRQSMHATQPASPPLDPIHDERFALALGVILCFK